MKRRKILIVDDSKTSRAFLSKLLARHISNLILEAGSVEEALEILESEKVGAIILDHNMPNMNGMQFLKVKDAVADWAEIPVLVITAEAYGAGLITEYLKLGAMDFVPKMELKELIFVTRVQKCLQLFDAVTARKNLVHDLAQMKAKQEDLLKSALPARVYHELLDQGFYRPVAPKEAVVLFADVCDFTKYSSQSNASRLVTNLNRMIVRFERISAENGMHKIKTIGDEYMAVAGVFGEPVSCHNIMRAAFQMIAETEELGIGWRVKVGLARGPVIGGIIGAERIQFDV